MNQQFEQRGSASESGANVRGDLSEGVFRSGGPLGDLLTGRPDTRYRSPNYDDLVLSPYAGPRRGEPTPASQFDWRVLPDAGVGDINYLRRELPRETTRRRDQQTPLERAHDLRRRRQRSLGRAALQRQRERQPPFRQLVALGALEQMPPGFLARPDYWRA